MQALVTTPGRPGTIRLGTLPESSGEPGIRVRTLEVGVCGTDREISEGEFGIAPEGEEDLVLGHDSRPRPVSIDGPVIGIDAVLENRVLVGSVNAGPDDWRGAVAGLEEIQRRWPGSLEAMIGLRVAPDRFAEAFAFRGVKATLVFD